MSDAGAGSGLVRLLEIEPELGEGLTPEEQALVGRVAVPVTALSNCDIDVKQVLADADAFAALVIDGILLHRMTMGAQPSLRLLGSGDVLSRSGAARTALLTESSYRASGMVRLALLDNRVLLIARRFPQMFTGLQARLGEQHQRLAAQLAICQLPRVEDRLLALMWLLAETWGRVTARGTVVALSLTHGALGELVGARRPTITLALKELSERGSLVRQDREWLLLEPPPHVSGPIPVRSDPEAIVAEPAHWAGPPPPSVPERRFEELAAIIAVLRDNQTRNAGEVTNRLARARRTRERSESLRQQIARDRLSRRGSVAPRRPAP